MFQQDPEDKLNDLKLIFDTLQDKHKTLSVAVQADLDPVKQKKTRSDHETLRLKLRIEELEEKTKAVERNYADLSRRSRR